MRFLAYCFACSSAILARRAVRLSSAVLDCGPPAWTMAATTARSTRSVHWAMSVAAGTRDGDRTNGVTMLPGPMVIGLLALTASVSFSQYTSRTVGTRWRAHTEAMYRTQAGSLVSTWARCTSKTTAAFTVSPSLSSGTASAVSSAGLFSVQRSDVKSTLTGSGMSTSTSRLRITSTNRLGNLRNRSMGASCSLVTTGDRFRIRKDRYTRNTTVRVFIAT